MAKPKSPLPESETEGADRDTKKLQAVHERAMRRFDAVAVPQREMRSEMLADRRFTTITGAMWEGQFYTEDDLTPRPEVDKITKPLEKIEEDWRENGLDVTFLPAENADQDTAETLNDAFRADAHVYKAKASWTNGLKEATKGGMGAWRLTSDYADPYDPSNDHQRINPGVIIPDADQCVYFYGGVKLDGSDAKAGFVIANELRMEFNDKWGEENADPFPVPNWKWAWDWYRADIVQTAEYFEVEDTDDEILIFTQEQSGEEQRYFKSEIEEGVAAELKAQGWSKTTRPWKRRRIHKYIMNGSRILKDCGYIAGDCIPIVVVYGRVDWVDNLLRIRGYTRKKKDAQRILNSGVARVQEVDSIAPFEVPIVADEQLDDALMQEWAEANIKRYPFRRLKPLRQEDGTIVSAGPLGKIDPPSVPETTAALLQFSVQMLSDDDEDAQVPANTSAEAIELTQNRVDSKSIIYLDGMAEALARTGEIWRGMARELYYEPGREIETRNVDGKVSKAELNQLTVDPTSGIYKIRNDLTRGTFHVEASVQEATATKRQKAFRMGMELGNAFMTAQSPQDALAAFYTAAENVDGEGIDDLRDFYRQRSIAIGATKPTPEEAQAMQAAEQNKQPDPSQVALQQQAQKLAAEAEQAQAGAQQKQADARLKTAQAEVLEKAPKVPQGLSPAPESPNPVEQVETLASAKLKNAQADHLHQQMAHQRIKTGADLQKQHHDQEMARRTADLAERQQQHAESQPAAGAE